MASTNEGGSNNEPTAVAENGNVAQGEQRDGGVGGGVGGRPPRQQGWRGPGGSRFDRVDRRPPRDGGDGRNENEFRLGNREESVFEGRGPPRGGFRGRGGRGGGGRGGGGPRGEMGGLGPRSADDRLFERIAQLNGPTFDLPPLDTAEKKFSGRARLYVGNLPPDATEEELGELFKVYGETNELFYNKDKNFGFVRLDYHANAERAKRELDGTNFKGRTLKIRFSPNGSTIKIRNLTPFVSNELLHYAFGSFGEIERACVIVDDRGKSTGEGIVEFARKGSAVLAIRKCDENCFFLTSSLRPVIVEQYDIVDDSEGFSEKSIIKKNMDFQRSREMGPRFANVNGFEHEYGTRWKQLHELFAQKEQGLKQELDMEKEKLEAQMEYARYEHETEMLREQLRVREMERERHKRDWDIKDQLVDGIRQRNQDRMLGFQDEMKTRIARPEEDMKRHQQESNLFMQAHKLDSLLDKEEQIFEKPADFDATVPAEATAAADSNQPLDPKAFMNQFERNRFEGRAGGNMGGRWVNEGRGGNRDDFANKRRRF